MWWYRKPSSIHSDDFLESYPENPFTNKNYQNFRLSLIMKANKKLKMFFSWSFSNLVGWKFNLYHLLLNWSSIFPSNHKLNREQSRSLGVCSGLACIFFDFAELCKVWTRLDNIYNLPKLQRGILVKCLI